VGIAKTEGILLKQRYKFTMKKLNSLLRFQHTKKGSKAAKKARKKIKTIAGRLVRELDRTLTEQALQKNQSQLSIYKKVILQKRTDKNKIYSLHEPEVRCYTKGKEHKKFEFGSKAAILTTQTTNVIVGAIYFNENIHDSKTLPTAIEQYEN
jgi:transposase, IS5 family